MAAERSNNACVGLHSLAFKIVRPFRNFHTMAVVGHARIHERTFSAQGGWNGDHGTARRGLRNTREREGGSGGVDHQRSSVASAHEVCPKADQ